MKTKQDIIGDCLLYGYAMFCALVLVYIFSGGDIQEFRYRNHAGERGTRQHSEVSRHTIKADRPRDKDSRLRPQRLAPVVGAFIIKRLLF